MIEKQREEREKQRKQKEIGNRRLEAIEHQYRTQMRLMQEKNSTIGRRGFNSTDHKSIIEELEKGLKKENEKQIMGLRMKMRREEAQLDDDLERLQREIISTYKRN